LSLIKKHLAFLMSYEDCYDFRMINLNKYINRAVHIYFILISIFDLKTLSYYPFMQICLHPNLWRVETLRGP